MMECVRLSERVRMLKRFGYFPAIIVFFCIGLVFFPVRSAAEAEPVRLQLKWMHSFQFAGYYAAVEKGFYRDAGLSVELVEGRPGVDFIEQVVSGAAEYGVESPGLLPARSRGAPVVVLAAVFQHSPLALLALRDSALHSPQDFVGKKVMVRRGADIEVRAMFAKEGVTPDKIRYVDHSWELDDLINGTADAISVYVTSQPFLLEEQGYEGCVINPVQYGIDFYGDCLFTSEKELKKNPARVAAFRAASLLGWEYAMEHPEEIIALIRRDYRPDLSEAALRFEAEKMRELILPEFIAVGHMNPGRWRHIAEIYEELGMMEPGYSMEGFLYAPGSRPLSPWVRWSVILLSVSGGLGLLTGLTLSLFNRRLASAVHARTADLRSSNALLMREVGERGRAERIARESKEHMETVLRSIADAVMAVDTSGHIVQLNPEAERLTGWTEEDAVSKPIDEVFRVVDATTRQPVENPAEKVLKSGETVSLARHMMLLSRDGAEYQIADSAAPILGADGRTAGVVLVFRDVTEFAVQEERLRKSELRYKTFFENSADAMLIIERGRFVDCNAAAVEMLGYDRKEELLNFHPAELSPEFQPDGQSSTAKADAIMQRVGEGESCRFEWMHRRKDGTDIPVEVSLTAIETDAGIQLHTALRDISERKKAQREKERLALAIEQAAEIIVITDADARIEYVNTAFEKITGYTRDEAIGKNPRFLNSGRQDDEFYQKMWKQLNSGRPWSGRFVNRKKDGSLYTEEATISPVLDASGSIVNYIVAKQDITSQIQMEEQLRQAQKMEAVGQMAGGVAHDFNNLLQVVCGHAEMALLDMEPDTDAANSMERISRAAQRGKQLVSHLLAFSRRQVMQPEDLDLNGLIEMLLKMIRGVIGEHIKLSFIPGYHLGTVHADRGLLEQAVVNLCMNARDAMPQGGTLTIETENVLINEEFAKSHSWSVAGRCVLLTLTDSGCGMDKGTLQHIFEPFFTTKEVGKGTGLGLSMVYGIIQQHRGQITAYSEPDKGTVFKIYLPEVERHIEEVAGEVSSPVPGGSETILVAEDDSAVLQLTERTLKKAGYTVFCARDGAEAVKVFQEHSDEIDLVLLDVVMPRMGGKKALEEMLVHRPGLPHLFASGYSENAVHTGFIKKRGLHLIGKPYHADALLRKVREILDAGSD